MKAMKIQRLGDRFPGKTWLGRTSQGGGF